MKRQIKKAFCILLFLILSACFLCSCSKPVHYDYTGELDNVKSIEFINIPSLEDFYNDAPNYELIKSIPADKWPDVLAKAAGLKYGHLFGDPPFLRAGEALKVEFLEPVDGRIFILYSPDSFAEAKMVNGAVDIDSFAPHCIEGWDEFADTLR